MENYIQCGDYRIECMKDFNHEICDELESEIIGIGSEAYLKACGFDYCLLRYTFDSIETLFEENQIPSISKAVELIENIIMGNNDESKTMKRAIIMAAIESPHRHMKENQFLTDIIKGRLD